jgi:hypothetical protein
VSLKQSEKFILERQFLVMFRLSLSVLHYGFDIRLANRERAVTRLPTIRLVMPFQGERMLR